SSGNESALALPVRGRRLLSGRSVAPEIEIVVVIGGAVTLVVVTVPIRLDTLAVMSLDTKPFSAPAEEPAGTGCSGGRRGAFAALSGRVRATPLVKRTGAPTAARGKAFQIAKQVLRSSTVNFAACPSWARSDHPMAPFLHPTSQLSGEQPPEIK